MNWKETIKKCEWVIIPVALMVAAWFAGDYYGQKLIRDSYQSQVDTVVKVVTVYKDFPNPKETAQIGYISVPTYKFITDTINAVESLVLHDTTVVYLPREQKYYEEEEGRLRMWVSGYEPRLDRYELDAVTTTITNTIVQSRTRWALSISGGYGAAYYDKRVVLAPYIGIGVSYNILNF